MDAICLLPPIEASAVDDWQGKGSIKVLETLVTFEEFGRGHAVQRYSVCDDACLVGHGMPRYSEITSGVWYGCGYQP